MKMGYVLLFSFSLSARSHCLILFVPINPQEIEGEDEEEVEEIEEEAEEAEDGEEELADENEDLNYENEELEADLVRVVLLHI
jgi:hypothetical protein